jgi:hypothetical protein
VKIRSAVGIGNCGSFGPTSCICFQLEMKDKVANSFKRLMANFEFASCLKQEANDMKSHRYANLRNAQFLLFSLCVIDNRLTTLKQQNT